MPPDTGRNPSFISTKGKKKTQYLAMSSNLQAMEVCLMTKTNVSNACQNINMARDDLMEHMGEEFFEPKHDELLNQRLRDGKEYSEGSRVEATNSTINPSSRARQLTIIAAWKIHHKKIAFNISAVKVDALLVCMLLRSHHVSYDTT